MGLTPDPDCKFDNKLYGRMYTLMRRAVTGTLHWQELVSFFFAHGLTVEQTVEHVPEDRRFGLTAYQGGDETLLGSYIHQTCDEDDERLPKHDETECPYLSDNDVVWDYGNVSEQDTNDPKISGEDETSEGKSSSVVLCDEDHVLQDDSANGAVEYTHELAGGDTEDDAAGDTEKDTDDGGENWDG
ncbi:hypothetical protein BKA63DRAFT_587744 [Paraphoma chrysanthemicola]|nr:hypothetical protein BKA63DRAFT_587744 [Paraphoma chrysanthemicola]